VRWHEQRGATPRSRLLSTTADAVDEV